MHAKYADTDNEFKNKTLSRVWLSVLPTELDHLAWKSCYQFLSVSRLTLLFTALRRWCLNKKKWPNHNNNLILWFLSFLSCLNQAIMGLQLNWLITGIFNSITCITIATHSPRPHHCFVPGRKTAHKNKTKCLNAGSVSMKHDAWMHSISFDKQQVPLTH